MTDDTPLTWIDPDTGAVELPLHLSLEWFDNLRSGVVGIVTLIADQEGGWSLTIQPAQAAIDAAVEKVKQKLEGDDDGS